MTNDESNTYVIRHLPLNFDDVPQNVGQHLGGRLIGIDTMHEMFAVKIQDGLGFLFVRLQAIADHVQAGVVQSIFLQSAALHAQHEIVEILAAQIKDRDDVQRVAQHFSLVPIAGDAIQHERVGFRNEPAGLGGVFDELAPKVDGRFVGHQFAPAGVIEENAADLAFDREITENITAGAVIEVGDVAQDLALGSFARARGAEEEDRAVFHGVR